MLSRCNKFCDSWWVLVCLHCKLNLVLCNASGTGALSSNSKKKLMSRRCHQEVNQICWFRSCLNQNYILACVPLGRGFDGSTFAELEGPPGLGSRVLHVRTYKSYCSTCSRKGWCLLTDLIASLYRKETWIAISVINISRITCEILYNCGSCKILPLYIKET
jgi:hypothetical protein